MNTDYQRGYLQGLIDSGWTCGDCGNHYQAEVPECPNRDIDELKASLRREPQAQQGSNGWGWVNATDRS